TLSTAIQFAEDCIARGMDPDRFLPRFTFFFDISISFFEEVAKMRAGRRIWARVVKDRLGAKNENAQRFKFHAQTSGLDLTRQQPLNNIARVTAQAIAGIFGGLQSMHTDSFDEVLSTPTEAAAKIAIATQNILREEAHLSEVIDPLAGSYYVETMTNEMEAKILDVMDKVAEAGGMFEACRKGLVQRMIGESAARFQDQVDSGEQTIVGVNRYVDDEAGAAPVTPLPRPDADLMNKHLETLRKFKAERSQAAVAKALDELTRAAEDETVNIFAKVVEAVEAGTTNGEVCARMRRDLGFGHPLVAA
ncbi:MAG: methylmalonyl-CoA mutase family protein, partial [Rhodospirillaceae bacterium]